MKDYWSKFNEVTQNLIAIAIVGVFIYLVIIGREVPVILDGFATAILLFFGYKNIKNGKVN